MIVGRNNGVVGLTGFSNESMCGLLFEPQKSSLTKGVVVWRARYHCEWGFAVRRVGGGGNLVTNNNDKNKETNNILFILHKCCTEMVINEHLFRPRKQDS